ncbi:MAG: DUF3187 family protein [Pseudomonadota bacterium]
MKYIILILFVVTLILSTELAAGFQGPLRVKNSFPLVMSIGSPSLVSAECENSVNLNLTYSSTHLVDVSNDWTVGIDLEAVLLDVQVKRLLGSSTEVSLELPLISFNSGFLDGFLEEYHSAFGFSDYGRSDRPHNDFLFEVARNGKTVVRGESGEIAPGDLRVGIKQALHPKDPCVSVSAFLELPTGDPDRGYGNGAIDGGVALLINKSLGREFMAYLNAGVVFAEELRAEQDIELNNYLHGGVELEWLYSEGVSLNAQFVIQDSPFRDTGIRSLDSTSTILSVGGKFKFNPKSALEVSFSEDTSTAGAPDFMVGVGYSYRF